MRLAALSHGFGILILSLGLSTELGKFQIPRMVPTKTHTAYFSSNLTATTVDIRIDLENDGAVEFTMSCVRK